MAKKHFLSRAELLNGHGALKIQDVERPSGGYVRVQQWTGADQQEIFDLQQQMDEKKQAVRFLATVIARSLVDEKGKLILEGNDDEVNALTKWPGADLIAIGRACLEINGMSVKAQEMLAKNS